MILSIAVNLSELSHNSLLEPKFTRLLIVLVFFELALYLNQMVPQCRELM